jgi:hypothetical protein
LTLLTNMVPSRKTAAQVSGHLSALFQYPEKFLARDFEISPVPSNSMV